MKKLSVQDVDRCVNEKQNSDSGEMQTKASSLSTDRVAKDITLTLAEIRERASRVRKHDQFAYFTQGEIQRIDDVDALLSIIDTLQRAIPLAAFESHKIDGRIAESISQCAASNMKAELIKRVREEMSGFTPESIERFAAKLEAVELTQDTESSKASHNPEVSVESSVQHQTESSSESTLVTEAAQRAAEKIVRQFQDRFDRMVARPDAREVAEIIATELSVHQPDVQLAAMPFSGEDFVEKVWQLTQDRDGWSKVTLRGLVTSLLRAASPAPDVQAADADVISRKGVLAAIQEAHAGTHFGATFRHAMGRIVKVIKAHPAASPAQPEVSREQDNAKSK